MLSTLFVAAAREMLEKGGFDIVGHFDKVGQNASYFHPGIEDSSFYVSAFFAGERSSRVLKNG